MSKALFAGMLMMLSPLPAWPAGQTPWLPNIISDHMLVQADQPIPLWGVDLPGAEISAKLNGVSASTKAGPDGRWELRLPQQKAGGPYQLVIVGSQPKTIEDVLVGELWLGSGQSNMEFALRGTSDRETEVPLANDGLLRFFNIDRRATFQIQDDVIGSWKVCTPENAKAFSAVAYHFGKVLRAKLKSPVGMITAAWGGTGAEPWVPQAALDQEPALAPLLNEWNADKDRQLLWSTGQDFEVTFKDIRFSGPQGESPTAENLFGSWTHSEKSPSTGTYEAVTATGGPGLGRYFGKALGGSWASALGHFAAGSVDLSTKGHLSLKVKGKGKVALSLSQPSISDYDFYYTNAYELTDQWQDISLGIDQFKQGGWGEPKPFTPKEISGLNFSLQIPYWPDLGAVVYNAMIAPLTRLPIRGVLWYQGESNAGRAAHYPIVMGALRESWRQAFGQPKLPFYVVQLPEWADSGGHWGALRNAQRLVVQADTNSALVSTLGLGEAHDVHPRNKKPVGERLAATAMSLVYGLPGEPLTPMLLSATRKGGKAILRFSHAEHGFQTVGEGSGLELAGADGAFHAAKFEANGSSLTLWCSAVSEPKQVRHAWADLPSGYLRAKDGLPLPSFVEALP